jgi:hypothetical protein
MFRAGVHGYLLKPFDEEDLLRHIHFHVHSAPAGDSPPGFREPGQMS